MDNLIMFDEMGGIIESELRSQLSRALSRGEEYHPFIGEVWRALQEYVQRPGRRIASCSTMIVYQGFSGRRDDQIARVCAGIELYRHSILVHDDIADAEMCRRGGKTLHRLLDDGRGGSFGTGAAIFAGNMLYSLALNAVLQSGFEPEGILEVVDLLSSGNKDVNESQILDLEFEHKKPDVDEWRAMAGKRAASLFETSMLSGAVLASAPPQDRLLLRKAARHIGYAFDIQDDIIDTFASKEQYGREPGGDLLKRKKPLHVVLAMQKEKSQPFILDKEGSIDEKDIPRIRDRIRESGALDEAKFISREHGEEAKRLISSTGMSGDAKGILIELIDYVVNSLDWYK